MTRYLCWIALLGSATVPDWASACYFRQYWAPPPCVIPPPVYCYPPPVVCIPVYPAPLPPPQVIPSRPQTQVIPAPMPQRVIEPQRSEAQPPATKPPIQPIIENTTVAPMPPVAIPTVAPMPMSIVPEPAASVPMAVPEVKSIAVPPREPVDPFPAQPADPMPKTLMEPRPAKPVDLPPLALPGSPEAAVPSPAPAPSGKEIIPPMVPKLPESPLPKPTENEPLPPLVLPPEAIPMNSTSKYSPAIAAPKAGLQVKVFVAMGAAGRPGLRKIGFYNHTDTDLALVIEGRAVTLPRKTFIHAEVPPTFRWKYADQPEQTVTVPEGAVGLDVLFR